jgi:uncharacterized protein YjbI with pentapeptide repeats
LNADERHEPPITKEAAIKLLQTNVHQWNKVREQHPNWAPDLQGAHIGHVDLQNAHLEGSNLEGAYFNTANLKGANLHRANLQRAILASADLRDAYLYMANLREANLAYANLKNALLYDADMKKARLFNSELQGAKVNRVDLRGADLSYANLEGADVGGVKFDRRGRYRGARVDGCFGSAHFKRFAQDEDYVEEFKNSSRLRFLLYFIWLVTADCGRSMWRWVLCMAGVVFVFAGIFLFLGRQEFRLVENLAWNFDTMLYYSVVTFTTLGFGDVSPLTTAAKHCVMAEVIIGYVMLGGLISILATKIARRS